MVQPDPQAEAFADAAESEWAKSEELLADAIVHEPGDPDAPPIKTPEEYDAEKWDAGRETPKTHTEAAAALAERIADPAAPDQPEHASAYVNPATGEV